MLIGPLQWYFLFGFIQNEFRTPVDLKFRPELDSTQAIIERFYINDPNKNLLDQPDFYSDAQQLIDKYISKHPPHTQNTAYQVDHLYGMSITGEVLIETI
ncbi:unnamed protein product [Adineta steineri]|uniref:Uncharacterized protein n=1 Tax=Adineta steineri TaxID=433720 RepID=A0A813X9G5_9BILA|nr:unnamed protein product [Adineta steineri]